MQESEQRFTLEELAELVHLSVRTIRYYIAENLLPGPGARGKAATYGEEHLLRLHLIRQLSEQHLPLAEMQTLLAGLSLDEIRALLAEKRQDNEQARIGQASTPKKYVETLLKKAQQNVSPYELPAASKHVSESAQPYATTSTTWQRWELAPGVELHIRSDAEYQQRTLLEQLFKAVGMIFKPPNRKS
jgi:DNA-binding transcriptional MerR regulator